MTRRALIAAIAAFALAGSAFAHDKLEQGRVVRFDAEESVLVFSSAAGVRMFRVTPETHFSDGRSNGIASRTARLVLRRGVELRLAATTGDHLDTVTMVRFERLPYADTSQFRPLPDLGAHSYAGRPGGLYPEGKNERPAAHEKAGLALAAQVRPLDEDGRAAANGRIVLLSVGMSNASQLFSAFKAIADLDPQKSPRISVVDGAQGGMVHCVTQQQPAKWTEPELTCSHRANDGSVGLTFKSEMGRGCRLQASTTPQSASWINLSSFTPVERSTTLGFPTAGFSRRFFRVVTP